jgi:hypothetical protein
MGMRRLSETLYTSVFTIFCLFFADVAPATDPALPLLASQRDGWTLLIVGAMMFFT